MNSWQTLHPSRGKYPSRRGEGVEEWPGGPLWSPAVPTAWRVSWKLRKCGRILQKTRHRTNHGESTCSQCSGRRRFKEGTLTDRVGQQLGSNRLIRLLGRENHPNNLPIQPTPFIGREKEVAAVQNLLRRDDVRLHA